MKHGDEKTTFLHQIIRHMKIHNNINVLRVDGHLVSDAIIIQHAFLSFYSNLLCCSMSSRKKINLIKIKHGVLNDYFRSKLTLSFSHDGIQHALWSIPDGKAPGLD